MQGLNCQGLQSNTPPLYICKLGYGHDTPPKGTPQGKTEGTLRSTTTVVIAEHDSRATREEQASLYGLEHSPECFPINWRLL